MSHRAVITGVGMLGAAGRGVESAVLAIEQRRCVLTLDQRLEELGTRCRFSGRLERVDEAFADLPIEKQARSFFGRFARIGAIAAFDAMSAAGSPAIGQVRVATAVGPMGELEICFKDTLAKAPHPLPAHAVTRVTPSFLATYLAAAFGAPRGGRNVSCACLSALEALADAVEAIGSGREQACLVGAVDEDSASTYWAFDRQRLLDTCATPERRTRALSGARGGFLPAGGAAFFVVESESFARSRGARCLARIGAPSIHSDRGAESLVAFPRSAYRAVLAELLVAGRPDLVLAHAPPSVADLDELGVLDDAIGLVTHRVPVRSYKSLLGYAMGAAGAIDIALAVAQLEASKLLPNDVMRLAGDAERFGPVVVGPPQARSLERVLKMVYAQGRVAGGLMIERGEAS
jgi:3-oxoacyl-(acyl-carrier-protein) synthase